MNTSSDQNDPYVLYVRAFRSHPDRWNGNEPTNAVGQLALALARKDACIGGNGLRTREEMCKEIRRYNAQPITYASSHVRATSRSRIRTPRSRGHVWHDIVMGEHIR